jgi:nitrogen fixation protein FixH
MITRAPRSTGRRFTGWHFTAIIVAFFGVVVSVNLYMARSAVSSFGGVVVDNSYVASQNFNGWLAAGRAQQALGWTVAAHRLPDGRVAVDTQGPGLAASLVAEARPPLGSAAARPLQFVADGKGGFVSRQQLEEGRWTLRLAVTEGEHAWRGEIAL